jgi:hypothetical protein
MRAWQAAKKGQKKARCKERAESNSCEELEETGASCRIAARNANDQL